MRGLEESKKSPFTQHTQFRFTYFTNLTSCFNSKLTEHLYGLAQISQFLTFFSAFRFGCLLTYTLLRYNSLQKPFLMLPRSHNILFATECNIKWLMIEI